MDITGGTIAGYAYGIPALLVGLASAAFGVLFLLAGTGGAVATLLFGIVLLIGAVVSMPVSRRTVHDKVGISFSRGAVVGVCGVVSVLATVLFVVGVIGLLGSGASAVPGADVSNISVSANDVNSGSGSALSITWNSRAQSAVDPDSGDMSTYRAEDGQKFVVIRMQITNTGTEDIDLSPRFFKLQSSSVVYDYQGLFGSSSGGLSGVTLQPDGDYSGWIAFSVPSDTQSASLITDQSVYYDRNISVSFEHDSSMSINVSD